MSSSATDRDFTPRSPTLVALACTAAFVLVLCAPMVTGRFLAAPHSDQFIAGYAFRNFWTEYVRSHGSIPLWNPFIFGGLPYIGAMHGDLLYPFSWIRLVVPTAIAMNLAFFVHLILAGFFTYLLLRALRLPWAAAVLGGIAYQLSGQVASLVRPGHDGKLYVSALLPLGLWALVRWVRDGKLSAAGLFGVIVGCAILSPSFQMAYYFLLAAGMFTLYLVFWDPERPTARRVVWTRLGVAAGAAVLGLGVAAPQVLPFLDYLPFSPRSVPGSSSGWDYATSFAMPPEELLSTLLPQLWGSVETYHGRNPLKLHSDYLGVVPLILATVGLLGTERRRLRWAFVAIAGFFVLVSLGGHTPFYRLVYELLPMMKKVRAPSMAFYIPALAVAVWSALGVERLWRAPAEQVRGLLPWLVALAVMLVAAVAGIFTNLARSLADPGQVALATANQPAVAWGAVRLVAFGIALAALLWAWRTTRIGPAAFAFALPLLAGLDLWSWNRKSFVFSPSAAQTFAEDDVTRHIHAAPPPARVIDDGAYGWSILMGYDIPQVLGYHGNEIRYYDELLGGKNLWRHLPMPTLWNLLAVRFIITGDSVTIPGYHHVTGPVTTAQGRTAHLYEADTVPPYARVTTAGARVPADVVIPTLLDPRLGGFDRVVLFDESQPVSPPAISALPPPSPARAVVTAWEPGRMTIELNPVPPAPSYLLVAENWYPGWQATVDARPAQPLRGNQSLLTVALPAGAKRVDLEFTAPAFARGRLASLGALLVLVGIAVGPAVARWRGRPRG